MTGLEYGITTIDNYMERIDIQSAPVSIGFAALTIAHGYVGQKEVPAGSNAGEFVEGCLKLVGLGKGYSWCQAFVYRCFHEAALQIGRANPVPKTAGVLKCWQSAPAPLKINKKKTPIAGSQFIMDYGKGLGHTGIVVSVEGDTFTTIEGNTDANGSRTGGMVCLRSRRFDDPKLVGFIQYV